MGILGFFSELCYIQSKAAASGAAKRLMGNAPAIAGRRKDMPVHINLPLQWVHEQSLWLDCFVAARIHPELGLDAASLALDDSWHKKTAARFAEAGLSCSIHLPFLGLDPAEPDDSASAAAREALRRGADIARIYRAAHMIGHPYYRPPKAGREKDSIGGAWLEKSLQTWPEMARRGECTLFLENTYERNPASLCALVAAVNAHCSGVETGICFDIGHWSAFAGCQSHHELAGWLLSCMGLKLHLHLHDNDGSADQHLGLGQGRIPFPFLFDILSSRERTVTATLEPHSIEAVAASCRWFAAHPDAAAFLDWQAPLLELLPLEQLESLINTRSADG